MDKLVFADPFQRPAPSRLADANAEDRYYRLYEPRSYRDVFSIATMAAIVGFLALSLDLLPR